MKYFIESVKHYIDSPNNSSLLLTGEWGTGKTYFIKNILIKELLSNGKECLYISLNGIRNTNEIVRQIIATKLKLSQNVIIGSSFLKSILDIGSLIPGLEKLKEISFNSNTNIIKLFDFKDNFIVFDDLERLSSEYKLEDFFGFINTEFIEHNGYKILFVANEVEINNDSYSSIKEKIIEHSYRFTSDIDQIYKEYIGELEGNTAWFYTEYQKAILDCIHKFKIKNLRTVFSAFKALNYINNTVTKEALAYHHTSIILFTFSVINEIKIGNLRIEDLEDNKGLEKLTNLVRTKQLLNTIYENNKVYEPQNDIEEKAESYEEYFTRIYLDNNPDKYKFYHSIFTLLLIGYVSPDELLKEITINPGIPEHKEAEEIMVRYMEYDEDTVKENVKNVLDFAEKGKYPPLSYSYFYHWLSMFAKNKVIRIRAKSLEKKLIRGFNSSAKENGFNYNKFDKDYYSVANTPNNPLWIYINKKIDNLAKRDEIKRYNEIFDIIDDDTKLYEYFEKNQHPCIFDKIDIQRLAKNIKKSKASSIFRLTQYIIHRYNFENIYEYYTPELEGIEKLIKELKVTRIDKNKYPLKVLAINNLIEDLESIHKRIKR